jgi:hypothetical protein
MRTSVNTRIIDEEHTSASIAERTVQSYFTSISTQFHSTYYGYFLISL